MKVSRRFVRTLFLITFFFFCSQHVVAQYNFEDVSLSFVLEQINRESEYSVLYRESALSDIRVTFTANEENLIQLLIRQVEANGVGILVDEAEKQLVLYRQTNDETKKSIYLSGQIVDSSTGERLPFSTLSWRSGSARKGVVANESGVFSFQRTFTASKIELEASYVGYKSQRLTFTRSDIAKPGDITFRLQPQATASQEVVVTGIGDFSESVMSRKVIEISSGSILGETNTLKSLQNLPAITQGTALSDGLNVRGSPADGFQVLLDGVTIYSQTHMFGLFDNFNADALKTSGLFYDVTPANYQAPSGGTLSLINKTGSLQEHKYQAGISNTSFRATIEGPIRKGRSSFLLSGRLSYLDQVDWFQNSDLVQWGLDVNRPRQISGGGDFSNFQRGILKPQDNDARFGDVHLKFYSEQKNGRRFILSGYIGFDDIQQNSLRLFRSFDAIDGSSTEFQPVQTENNWYNGVGSVQYHVPLRSNLYQKTTLGVSSFGTEFNKDDFTYTQISRKNGALESFTSSLKVENILNELLVKHQYDHQTGRFFNGFGVSYRYFENEYFEDSFLRPNLFIEEQAHKMDAFVQSGVQFGEIIELNAGIRGHYFSSGEYLDWSPRAKLKLLPNREISAGVGYSKNFQHVNRISFSNVLTSDVWILVNENQPPTETEQFTAGIYLDFSGKVAFQAEGYLKDFKFLRLHEIDTFSSANALGASPWFADNSAEARGLEFTLINVLGSFKITQGLTVSEMEIQNEDINNGEPFFAGWDRTYQYSATAMASITGHLSLSADFVYATGTPDKLAVFGNEKENRLGDYYRVDIGSNYEKKFKDTVVIVSLSVYNLLDRNNSWYRELTF